MEKERRARCKILTDISLSFSVTMASSLRWPRGCPLLLGPLDREKCATSGGPLLALAPPLDWSTAWEVEARRLALCSDDELVLPLPPTLSGRDPLTSPAPPAPPPLPTNVPVSLE